MYFPKIYFLKSFPNVSIFPKLEIDITYSGINFPKHYLPSQIKFFQYFPIYFFLPIIPILEMYFPKIYFLESFPKVSIFPKLKFDITYSGINFPKHYLPSSKNHCFWIFPKLFLPSHYIILVLHIVYILEFSPILEMYLSLESFPKV